MVKYSRALEFEHDKTDVDGNFYLRAIANELAEPNQLRKELIKTLIVLGQDKQ